MPTAYCQLPPSKLDSLLNQLATYNLKPETRTDTTRINLLYELCSISRFSDPEKAMEYGKQGIELSKKLGLEEKTAWGYSLTGIVNYYSGEYDKALGNYFTSLKIFEKLEQSTDKGISRSGEKGIAENLHNIGKVYFRQQQFPKAMEFYHQALKINQRIGYRSGTATCLNNIGGIYMAQKNYNKVIIMLKKALEIFKELNDRNNMATCLNNIGLSYRSLHDLDKAFEFQMAALNIREELNDGKGLAYSYVDLGLLCFQLGKKDKSLTYLEKSLEISKKIKVKERIKASYEALSQIHSELRNYRQAYDYFQQYVRIKDTLLNDATTKQITEMETKYQSEKKQKEIELLKKDQEIQIAEVQRQRILRNSFIAASILAFLLAMVLLNRYKIKQKANRLLSSQNEQIRKQKDTIERQKQDITDSIEYASYIQKAVLPSDAEFKSAFPDSFILFKPRDIVSGDFYYLTLPTPSTRGAGQTCPSPSGEGGGTLLALGDCTGHGVPGAFMSMLCNALLNEAVNDKGLTQPNEIFESVRIGIISALKQRGQFGDANDGMDCSMIRFVETTCMASLQIACANNPIYIVSHGIMTEIKPDRQPVGFSGHTFPYTLQEIKIKKGDMIYLSTDGFEDQLGGEKEKKFKSSRLKELLITIATLPVADQKIILDKNFEEWKGSREQTDDVTVIGIRI